MEDRSLVGQRESDMPAKQPKGSSTGTGSALDTGGQPVGGGAAAECLTTHSVLVLGISSAPHEGRASCLTAVRAGAQAGFHITCSSSSGLTQFLL